MSHSRPCQFSIAAILTLCSGTPAQEILRASINNVGTQANATSERPEVAANGRFVVFRSAATNLVSNDTNGKEDIFVHDRLAATTTRVSVSSVSSVSSVGGQADDSSNDPTISADGRFVAFASSATNLVANDTNGKQDVFVHDRETGATIRMLGRANAEPNDNSDFPSLSADGRMVACRSNATNLVPGDTNAAGDAFVFDQQTGQLFRVSVDSSGVQGDDDSQSPRLSWDGAVVVFNSDATNLVAGDTNSKQDVFVHVLATGATTRVSVDSTGAQGNGRSTSGALSADGRSIVFESDASNLVSSDVNSRSDVFRHDRITGETAIVSLSSNGVQGNRGSLRPSISYDGRFIGFSSDATNLAGSDANGVRDTFLRDTQESTTVALSWGASGLGDRMSDSTRVAFGGNLVVFRSGASNLVSGDTNGVDDIFVRTLTPFPETRMVNQNSRGIQGDKDANLRSDVSANGRYVAFSSAAGNLVANDSNVVDDVFVNDLASGRITRISVSTTAQQANGGSWEPRLSGDARFVAFTSLASNLTTDTNNSADIFLHDRQTGKTSLVSQGSNGAQGTLGSEKPAISADASVVVFASLDSLVNADTNGFRDIYARDWAGGITTRVSIGVSGNQADAGSYEPAVSATGRFVAFASLATNLVADDNNQAADVFVRDRLLGITTRISVSTLGHEGNGESRSPAISSDGEFVVFSSTANNLIAVDTNRASDVFVHNRGTGQTLLVSQNSQGVRATGGPSRFGGITPDGRFVAFQSGATNLVIDTNGADDIFIRDLKTGTTTRVSVDSLGNEAGSHSGWPAVSAGGAVVVFYSYANNLVPADLVRRDIFIHRRCDVLFESFGTGTAGSKGLIPYFQGQARSCTDYDLRVWNGMGRVPATLLIGFGEAAIPLFGGTIYVDLSRPTVTLPFALFGVSGLAGSGFQDLRLGYLGSLRGQTLIMQVGVLDAGAAQGVALTNGMRLRVND